MSRPKTKDELILAATSEYEKLLKLIDSMDDDKQNAEFAFDDRDKNLRDVLMHLHEWHLMVKSWYTVGVLESGMPSVPGEGYTWRTTPALNLAIWKKYQSVPLSAAKSMLDQSHKEIMKIINSHTNEELFDRGVYKWTGTNALGAYFVSSTSSHYDWAAKKIKKHIKS